MNPTPYQLQNWVQPCPQCPKLYKAVGGDGPRPARVLFIAERPGEQENRYGRVLHGNTGQEYDGLYLPLAGLDRSSVRSCNTVLCWAENNRKPTDKEIAQCAPHHLPCEIASTQPEVIVLMGASACALVPGIDLEMHHGIPQHNSKVGTVETLFGWHGWLFPMYHPAMGMHESRWMKILMDDWEALGRLLRDGDDSDPEPEPHSYRVWDSSIRGLGYLGHHIGVDTEWHDGVPWSLQVSFMPRTGWLFRANDPRAIKAFNYAIRGREIILHNATSDLEVLRKLGVEVSSFRDTMQESFHRGNLPQGLKPLVYRLFRHTMTSYQDTVRPASINALQDWMVEAFKIAQSDLSYVETVKLKTKTKEVVKKGNCEKLLTRLMRNTDVASDYNPWMRLDAFWKDPLNEWAVMKLDARIGKYPTVGIANCSLPAAVEYAVGDADRTAQVADYFDKQPNQFKIWDGDISK